ncbi:oxidoreductase [Streptomyces sp. TRM66268-LWL]|uniref:Oxidoreductase n=1 Tax=Streptomyces polyasparticus TaxID=2767826 RepID=A0ABR7SK47_9ACTN|nr:oxidoreductase [Streptomyces polyasparticus]MBC9715334.1 oxidoreductase [Streptomyces polyasparticus]
MTPLAYRVTARWRETPDAVTLRLAPVGESLPGIAPGQYVAVAGHALPVSALPATGGLAVTVRAAAGPLLYEARTGEQLRLTGPYGGGWDLEKALGHDLVIVAYGIGLALLRPLIRDALADRAAYGGISLLIGAPAPDGLMATYETRRWQTTYTGLTVDRPDYRWHGEVGPVEGLLARTAFDPEYTSAFVCGPERMLHTVAGELARRGVHADRIRLAPQHACGDSTVCTLGEVHS